MTEQEEQRELLWVVILVLLATLSICALEARAETVPVTVTVTAGVTPPNGAVWVGEFGPNTYTCTWLVGRCVFSVDVPALDGTGACVYPKGNPTERQCGWYFRRITVAQSKRRAVRP